MGEPPPPGPDAPRLPTAYPLVRLGGGFGIAGCVVGLAVGTAAGLGLRAAVVFAWIPAALGLVGFVLCIAGRDRGGRGSISIAALLVCCLSVAAGLLVITLSRGGRITAG